MNKLIQLSASMSRVCASLVVLTLVGCGGGGSSSTSAIGGIGGTGFKGPVSGATVVAYAINNGAMDSQVSSGTTDTQGNFNLSMGTYAGVVMLQLTGGAYIDEATGTPMAMAHGDAMTAALPSMAGGAMISGVQLTPLTSMAQAAAQHMTGGMTDANIAAANTAVGSYFMVGDMLHTLPINPLVAGSGAAATQSSMNYGMTLAAMSQYAKNIGMTAASRIVTAMMKDAADGIMNGMGVGGQIAMGGGMMSGGMMQPNAGTTGLATSMADFMNSSLNKSGLTAADLAALMQQMRTSDWITHRRLRSARQSSTLPMRGTWKRSYG